MADKWIVCHRQWFCYKVACCVTSWALGSGYQYARSKRGFVQRFWTKRAAQTFADQLNRESPND